MPDGRIEKVCVQDAAESCPAEIIHIEAD